jgi:hypothetical protein
MPSSPRTPAWLSTESLERDWRALCADIGERRAGTREEKAAADYIARELRAARVPQVELEPFPCKSLRRASVDVRAELPGRGWQRVDSAALVGAPGTPGRGAIEGELVWIEFPEEAPRLKPGCLKGKILALFGPLPTNLALHRKLLAAAPAAVIHIDERLPFTWTKNDGVYPYWAQHHGMRPTLTVPYLDAWQWRQAGVKRLRVRVDVELASAESQNVIGSLPGTDAKLPAIVIGAHHDTQCGNVGADDNASGVVCLLALARAFAGHERPRTLRFISFGAEEQLSVGSAAHVRRNRISPRDVGFVVNFDSVASPLGHVEMWLAGAANLERHVTRRLASRDLHPAVRREICPFADMFAFNRAGIPSLWFMRANFSGGRWQHHSVHDNLDNVSVTEVQRLLGAVAPLIDDLASRASWPFSVALPAEQTAAARRLGRELFGW